MKKIRWGIVGTGYIANEFAKGMKTVDDGFLAAVVSRHFEKGKEFADRYGIEHAFTDFQQMMTQIRPDIVYIAVPNDCHYEYIMQALYNNTPVLSEKPMVDNMRQFNTVMAEAEDKKIFIHEGMWTRCFPAVREVRKWISAGRIGTPLTVRSSFDIKPTVNEWQPWKGGLAHAGGALRDVGIYSLAMAVMVFPEEPKNIFSVTKSNGEVDECFRMLIDYGDGRTALIGGAFNQISNAETEIVGEKGKITIGPEFWHPTTSILKMNDGTTEKYLETYPETGFQYEIKAVQNCLRKGAFECDDYTHRETRLIAEIIEGTRREWGIIYSSDKEGN